MALSKLLFGNTNIMKRKKEREKKVASFVHQEMCDMSAYVSHYAVPIMFLLIEIS